LEDILKIVDIDLVWSLVMIAGNAYQPKQGFSMGSPLAAG
jgi:hypothetical protein